MFGRFCLCLLVLGVLGAPLVGQGLVALQARAATQIAENNDQSLAFVDSYLERWDRFAQGEKDLVPELNADLEPFSKKLSALLEAEDPRAPARAVFFTTVQMAGEIHLETPLGRAMSRVLGKDVPVTKMSERPDAYSAWHLYSWWTENRERFEAYPLLEEWAQREFTKSTILPMYRRLLVAH